MSALLLGAFEVLDTIAAGGMGDVWRGVHVTQDIPVAIKVIRQKGTDDSLFVRAFRSEVRAVAQLDHPGIITLFDIGEVPKETADASAGALEFGSPYLIMEHLESGSLDALYYPLAWPRAREILVGVLDALGHAHACGITHRDLKPGNILLADELTGSPVRLADFGIAFSYRETHSKEADGLAVGTPTHMAPEQFLGEWRDLGPWTDLYALGCVAYQMASGRIPFEQRNLVQLGLAHIEHRPPKLNCPPDYPVGFEDWVMKLLNKKSIDRFMWCADAADSLASLEHSGSRGKRWRGASVTGEVAHSDWRAPASPLRPFKLIGAGLRLFGLRAVPIVGRDSERDRLWGVFNRVRAQGMPEFIVLEGAAGVGKSRLAEWLCERTHEMGVAESLRVEHDRSRGRESALSYMLADAWSCLGTSATELKERVKTVLTSTGVDSRRLRKALAELLAPAALGEEYVPGMFFKFRSRSARFSFLFEVLRGVFGDRSLVVWFDDVHLGSDSLHFLQYLLDRSQSEPFRMTAVLTVRDDLLVESREAADLLNQLCLRDEVERLRVEPLSDADSRLLAGSLLHLEGDLAASISERSGGNPLYATQLVGDWVSRGILVAGSSGFVLSSVETPEVPDDVHAVWVRRLERVLDESVSGLVGSSTPTMQRLQMQLAVELAVALDGRVDMAQWRAVCGLAGVADPGPVLESLLAFRLARLGVDSWTFTHSMLRDSIERIAREKRRWSSHNRMCADMLEQRHPVPHWGDSERIGCFRFESGELEAAVSPLIRGAREARRLEEYSSALGQLALCETALDKLGRPGDDPLRLEALLLRADTYCTRREFDRAEAMANELISLGKTEQTLRIGAEARLVLARVLHARGKLSTAFDSLTEAQQTLRKTGPKHKLAECLSEQAHTLLEMNRPEDAWSGFNEAQEIYEETGQLVAWAENQLGLARVLLRQGDSNHALALCRRVRAFARREELNRLEAVASMVIAEVEVAEGRLTDADSSLDESITLFEQLGLSLPTLQPRLLKVLLLLETGSVDRARLVFDQLRNSPEIDVQNDVQLLIACIDMTLAVDRSDSVFKSCFDRMTLLLAEAEVLASEVTRCLLVAFQRAENNGFPERVSVIKRASAEISPLGVGGEAGTQES